MGGIDSRYELVALNQVDSEVMIRLRVVRIGECVAPDQKDPSEAHDQGYEKEHERNTPAVGAAHPALASASR